MQSRKANGRFSRSGTSILLWTLIATVLLLIVGNIIGNWVGEQNTVDAKHIDTLKSFIAPTVSAAEVTPDRLQSKIDQLKNDVLDQLSKCESGGKKEEDGITVLDTNNVGSYGAFQFQRKSVIYYYQKMTGTPINGRDAIILAMTPDKARALASWIIFSTDAGVAHDWVNCSAKHGLQAKVDIIKSLEI